MAGPRSALVNERRERERDREFLRAVADASPNLLVVIDDTATVAGNSVNKGFERAIGWTEQEMLGRSLLDLFAPEDRDVALLGVAAALNGLEPMERVRETMIRTGEHAQLVRLRGALEEDPPMIGRHDVVGAGLDDQEMARAGGCIDVTAGADLGHQRGAG